MTASFFFNQCFRFIDFCLGAFMRLAFLSSLLLILIFLRMLSFFLPPLLFLLDSSAMRCSCVRFTSSFCAMAIGAAKNKKIMDKKIFI
jgi:hypothetical protein